MIDTYINILNLKDHISKALPNIKKAFITFYGDESFVNEKLDNLYLVGYGLMDKLHSILYNIKECINDELISKFLEPFSDKDFAKKIFFGEGTFEYLNLFPFYEYLTYRRDLLNGEEYLNKTYALKFLQTINHSVKEENMDYLIKNNTFSDFDKLIFKFEELIKEYNERMQEYQSFIEMELQTRKEKESIKLECYHKLIDEFAYLFPEKMHQEVKNNRYFYKDNMLTLFLGKSIDDTPIIGAFTSESDTLIQNGGWRSDSIKKDRIKFFKVLGYDLGDNYDDYMNNPTIKSIIPSKELIDKISSLKKSLYNEMLIKYYEGSKEYQKIKSEIDKTPFVVRSGIFDANYYSGNLTCVIPNAIKNDDGVLKCFPLVLINTSGLESYFDVKIIHELNHVFELSISEVSKKNVKYTCGWDYCCDEISSEEHETVIEEERKKRNYELFNEIINELIAQEITTIMHDNGDYIINNSSDVKIKGGTSYEHMNFLARDFYEQYKEDIILSRRNGNIDIILDKVGKENFDELNELFHLFNEHLSGFRFYKMLDSLQKGEETEETRIFHELKDKRDAILEKMREYRKEKS